MKESRVVGERAAMALAVWLDMEKRRRRRRRRRRKGELDLYFI